MKNTLLVVGHGSREAKANKGFEDFVQNFQKHVPDEKVSFGYLEIASPTLPEALESVARESETVTILPLFLFSAGHVKNDLPAAVQEIQKKFPNVQFSTAPALGANPLMLKLLSKRTDEAAAALSAPKSKTILIVIGRGASDSEANEDFCKLVRMFEESSGFSSVKICYCAMSKPFLEETLNHAAAGRPEAILIQPYLLFPGKLIQKIEEEAGIFSKKHSGIQIRVGKSLGEDESIFELLKEKVHLKK